MLEKIYTHTNIYISLFFLIGIIALLSITLLINIKRLKNNIAHTNIIVDNIIVKNNKINETKNYLSQRTQQALDTFKNYLKLRYIYRIIKRKKT